MLDDSKSDDNEIIEKIGELKLIPVVSIDDPEHALPLAEALLAGGLPCAEITLRTPAALDAMERIAGWDQVLLGAGTVLDVEQARHAVEAGATFVVSPGLDPRIVEWCLDNEIAVFPGVATPSELMEARRLGLEILKFFPAEALGGLKTLKAIAAPFTGMRFIPTGGVNADNVGSWLAHPQVHACGGSWMVEKQLIREGRFDEITRRVKEAMSLIPRTT